MSAVTANPEGGRVRHTDARDGVGGPQGAMKEVLCATSLAPFSRVRSDLWELSAWRTPGLGKARSGFAHFARAGSRGTQSLRNLQRPAAIIIGKRSFGALRPLCLS
jgi:hypothetical protein